MSARHACGCLGSDLRHAVACLGGVVFAPRSERLRSDLRHAVACLGGIVFIVLAPRSEHLSDEQAVAGSKLIENISCSNRKCLIYSSIVNPVRTRV